MALFSRKRDDDAQVPRIDVRGDEATIDPDPASLSEDESSRQPDPGEPRRVKLPKSTWH
jgi:hypothetical protein